MYVKVNNVVIQFCEEVFTFLHFLCKTSIPLLGSFFFFQVDLRGHIYLGGSCHWGLRNISFSLLGLKSKSPCRNMVFKSDQRSTQPVCCSLPSLVDEWERRKPTAVCRTTSSNLCPTLLYTPHACWDWFTEFPSLLLINPSSSQIFKIFKISYQEKVWPNPHHPLPSKMPTSRTMSTGQSAQSRQNNIKSVQTSLHLQGKEGRPRIRSRLSVQDENCGKRKDSTTS